MAWVVTDDQGNAAGVGSRYFRVFNGAQAQVSSALAAEHAVSVAADHAEYAVAVAADHAEYAEFAAGGTDAIEARRGFAMDAPFRRYPVGDDGRVTLQSEELDRIEINTRATEGFLVVGSELKPLPIGSRLDPASGIFVWQPGVGFVGSYDLAFVRPSAQGQRASRQDVRIVLNPKGDNRVGPQIVVDIAPGSGQLGSVLAGWAADLDSPIDTGIDMLHVWAYPTDGSLKQPVFVGEASYGGHRPDVAAVYGERFRASGYGLRVEGLAPGSYDLAVFAWSSATHAWLPAKVVRVDAR